METDTMKSGTGQLVRLTQVEYEIEPGQPNMIGWSVIDADGDEIGALDDMLIDIDTGVIPFGSVCYDDKCKVVPVELIFLDDEKQRLVLPVTKTELDTSPDFSDKTEDMQPHVDFWNELVTQWQKEMALEGKFPPAYEEEPAS